MSGDPKAGESSEASDSKKSPSGTDVLSVETGAGTDSDSGSASYEGETTAGADASGCWGGEITREVDNGDGVYRS